MFMCNETVTLVRLHKGKTDDSYTCDVIVGVSWFAKFTVVPSARMGDNGMTAENVVRVRIPEGNMPDGVIPQKGDYLARGVLDGVASLDDLKPFEYFKVLTVGDNRRGNLRHWAVRGA